MNKIKEKLTILNKEILKKEFLEKMVKSFWYNYEMDNLSNLWYISVIKNWKYYYNNQIRIIKDPYIIWACYADFEDFVFWWGDLFNKYGFTTQISNVFTVYNLKYSKEIEILWVKYQFKKVKKEFLYWKQAKLIRWYKVYFMDRERCFLEFVRTYLDYENNFFVNIYKSLDKINLTKIAKKYPLQNVLIKLKQIEKCI